MPDRSLHIPQGTEAFYLEEAYVHRTLLRSFEDCCTSWAYLPVQTPVYDFHDVYRGVADRTRDSATYRLVDRDGALLVLRSDVTLFLARQMGLVLTETDLPVRVHYADTILRHEDPHDLSKNEFYQVGAELIGSGGIEADAEIILLLFDAFHAWKANETVLHLGHRALLPARPDALQIVDAVAFRDWPGVRRLLEAEGYSRRRTDELVDLYGFIGTAAELSDRVTAMESLTAGERSTIEYLVSLVTECASLGYEDRIRIDLSEVGSQPYHSGIVFNLYADGADAPLASGGRYDGLLGHFGFSAPSVGFSVMLRRLQSWLLPRSAIEVPRALTAGGRTFRLRVEEARRLRADGKVVRL